MNIFLNHTISSIEYDGMSVLRKNLFFRQKKKKKKNVFHKNVKKEKKVSKTLPNITFILSSISKTIDKRTQENNVPIDKFLIHQKLLGQKLPRQNH